MEKNNTINETSNGIGLVFPAIYSTRVRNMKQIEGGLEAGKHSVVLLDTF